MMSAQRADLAVMHRLLYCHLWTDLGDWVRAVGELADLSDAEIERVVGPRPDARSEKAENT